MEEEKDLDKIKETTRNRLNRNVENGATIHEAEICMRKK